MHGWNVIKRAIGSFSLASHESTTLATEPYAVALCDRIDLWLKSGHLNEIPAIFHFWSARTHEEKEKWKNSKKKKSLDVFVRGSKVIDTISVTIEQTKLIHNERFDKKKTKRNYCTNKLLAHWGIRFDDSVCAGQWQCSAQHITQCRQKFHFKSIVWPYVRTVKRWNIVRSFGR